jgi:hypothetical protein
MSTPGNESKPQSPHKNYAPECPKCHAGMKIRTVVPREREDIFGYRCDKCGEYVDRTVPRAR